MHSRANIEEMVKYQRLLQQEFAKSQAVIDRQARQVAKLEKDLAREAKVAQSFVEVQNSLKRQLEQKLVESMLRSASYALPVRISTQFSAPCAIVIQAHIFY